MPPLPMQRRDRPARPGGATGEPVVADDPTPQDVETAQPKAPVTTKTDLTSIPEFRSYQAEQDRKAAAEKRAQEERERAAQAREAALQSQIADITSTLNGMRDYVTRAQQTELDSLDPAEQVAILQRRLSETQAEQEQAKQKAVRDAEITRKSNEVGAKMNAKLTQHGLNWNDTMFNPMRGVADPDAAYAMFLEIIADYLAEQRTAAGQQVETRVETAKKQARVEAIRETGATATSNETGEVQTVDEDRSTILKNFKRRWGNLEGGKGDPQAVMRFRRDMRAKGVTFTDLGY